MADHEILLAIRDLLDGTVWDVEMLARIAEMLTENGYPIHDLDD